MQEDRNNISDPLNVSALAVLQTEPTDAEFAESIRAKAKIACMAVCAVMDEAATRGMLVQIGMGPGPTGRNTVQQLNISKIFPPA